MSTQKNNFFTRIFTRNHINKKSTKINNLNENAEVGFEIYHENYEKPNSIVVNIHPSFSQFFILIQNSSRLLLYIF
jgi:hypothetical protein